MFAPIKNISFTADYYIITLNNEVEYQSSDTILREEADCRLGQTLRGQPVPSRPVQQVIEPGRPQSRTATQATPRGITSVLVLPINAASDRTSGHRLQRPLLIDHRTLWQLRFKRGYTDVLTHTIQLWRGRSGR